ncbi:MAG TPA: hypothetical protein VF950_00390 [Planctomycetota bacterium]
MPDACAPFRPLLDGLADGEIDPSRVEPHLAACAPCRAELDAVRALKARLARVRLPDVPRRRLPARRAALAAAAALFAAVFFGAWLAAPAPLYALTARFHDDILSGRVTLSNLGIPPTAKKADYAGGCPCPPGLGAAAPFIVYRHEGAAVSLLAFESAGPWPDVARRVGDDTVIQESRNGFALIWISRLDEASLRRAAERWRPAPGTSLRAFACGACCALLEAREAGEGPVSIELVTGPGGRRVDASVRALLPLPR